ncbi:MAG: hypothetical protein ABL921_19500 [Pirellula sp.]
MFDTLEKECIGRLADMFEQGTMETDVRILFDGLQADDRQKNAICESLKSQGVIEPTYQFGSLLPYFIQINASIIKRRDALFRADQFQELSSPRRGVLQTIYDLACLWWGDPSTRFPKIVFLSGIALIAAPWWQPVFQQIVLKFFKLPEGPLANFDHKMFWSGWVVVAISVCLYLWPKRNSVSKV